MSPLAGKTVLVTGATGFIGRRLVERLSAGNDVRLLILTRRPDPLPWRGADIVKSPLHRLDGGVWRDSGVSRIDIVFHLGAFTPKSVSESDRVDEVYQDNLIGTRALLESLPSPPEKIIFASTLDVYAMPPVGVLDETSPLGPVGLYGASKLFCEEMVRAFARREGCGCAVLRYGHIFGPGEEGYDKLIPRMIRRLLRNEAPVLYGDGSAERDYLFVDDAVEATIRSALSSGNALGPVNLVRGASVPIGDVARLLAGLTGFRGEIEYLRDRPAGYSLRFDNRLMRELLGEWDFVPLEEGLKLEVESFRTLFGRPPGVA